MSHTTPMETGFTTPAEKNILNGYEREKTGNYNEQESEKAEDSFNYEYNTSSLIFKTGDEPGKGLYSCTNCGTDITLTDGNKIPPCPRCGNTEFSC